MAKSTDTAAALGKRILDQLKAMLGGDYPGLSAADKQLLTDVTADIGMVAIAKLSGKDTRRDELQLHAQVANLEDAGAERLRRNVWGAARIVLDGAVAFVKVAI